MNKNQKPWKTIMKRELTAYFTSPVAYIAGALFLVFSGLLFFSTFFLANRAELRSFFEYLPILFSFFIPALTMRVFSEEQKSGTMETLVTLPVTVRDIVVGKFLGAFVSSILLLVPTLFYVLTCVIFSESEVDAGPMFGGYIGHRYVQTGTYGTADQIVLEDVDELVVYRYVASRGYVGGQCDLEGPRRVYPPHDDVVSDGHPGAGSGESVYPDYTFVGVLRVAHRGG